MEDFSTNKNYQNLLEKGRILFWKHGIRRVTVEEICREAGVSKMTFYKFFPNKIDLGQTILSQLMENALQEFHDLVERPISFREKVQRMFEMKLEATKDISTEFLNDAFSNPAYGLKEMMESYRNESLKTFVEFLRDAQKKGLIRKGIRIEFIMTYLNSLTQLVYDKELQALYDHPQDLIMEAMNFMFYGLSTPSDQ